MENNRPLQPNREEFADAIRQLDVEDLRFLNRLIVERIKLINQAKSTAMLSQFNLGDRVSFSTPTGEPRSGIIIRLNKKTASITTDEGGRWNVHPSFLTLETQIDVKHQKENGDKLPHAKDA